MWSRRDDSSSVTAASSRGAACGTWFRWTVDGVPLDRRHPAARARGGELAAGVPARDARVDRPRATFAPAAIIAWTGAVRRGGSSGHVGVRRRCPNQSSTADYVRGVLHGQLGARGHEHRSPLRHPRTRSCRPASRPLPTGRRARRWRPDPSWAPAPGRPGGGSTSDHRCSVSKSVSCRGSSSEKCTRSRRSRGFIAPQGSGRADVWGRSAATARLTAAHPAAAGQRGRGSPVTTFSYSTDAPAKVRAGVLVLPMYSGPKDRSPVPA